MSSRPSTAQRTAIEAAIDSVESPVSAKRLLKRTKKQIRARIPADVKKVPLFYYTVDRMIANTPSFRKWSSLREVVRFNRWVQGAPENAKPPLEDTIFLLAVSQIMCRKANKFVNAVEQRGLKRWAAEEVSRLAGEAVVKCEPGVSPESFEESSLFCRQENTQSVSESLENDEEVIMKEEHGGMGSTTSEEERSRSWSGQVPPAPATTPPTFNQPSTNAEFVMIGGKVFRRTIENQPSLGVLPFCSGPVSTLQQETPITTPEFTVRQRAQQEHERLTQNRQPRTNYVSRGTQTDISSVNAASGGLLRDVKDALQDVVREGLETQFRRIIRRPPVTAPPPMPQLPPGITQEIRQQIRTEIETLRRRTIEQPRPPPRYQTAERALPPVMSRPRGYHPQQQQMDIRHLPHPSTFIRSNQDYHFR